MPAIRLLDRSVAELIAAGEVVERPASIIKELVENALDAGAGRIQVEIKNGGVRYIRVTDNGCGISFDEMPTAFLRHATSKISSQEDLDAIMTLGFRGEALASIAAMCRVELLSRQHESDMGGRCNIEGSEILLHQPAGCPIGTTIIVRDIFFNTPARMKFLKKDTTESAAVSQTLERLALINTTVSFSYIKDGKRMFTTPGDGQLLSAVGAIFGGEFASGLIPVEQQNGGITVAGLISSPEAVRATRSMQHFYINSRYIRSRMLTSALEEAYKHRIAGARFPGCVLNIKLRPEAVDVNVHPAKIEVRFSDERAVYNAVYSACKWALTPKEQIKSASADKINVFALRDFDYTNNQQTIKAHMPPPAAHAHAARPGRTGLPTQVQSPPTSAHSAVVRHAAYSDRKDTPLSNPQPNAHYAQSRAQVQVPHSCEANAAPPPCQATAHYLSITDSQPLATITADGAANVCEDIGFKVNGELFGTYILAETVDTFYIIDKHAAHERYLYNRIAENPGGLERQTLISPITVGLSKDEYAAAIENIEAFAQMGIIADDFGEGTLIVRELPMLLPSAELPAVIAQIAQAIAAHRRDLTPDFIAGLFASVACRGAVMAKDNSHKSEMEFIADLVINRGITNCPHGRPTCRRYKKSEIERMFGRLV